MLPDQAPDPGVVDQVDVDQSAPEPSDCLPPSESPIATVSLSPGWIAVTEREFLSYHPDRDPAVVRTVRGNVTGIAVRRTGGRAFLSYLPAGILYTVVALVAGGLLLAVSPADLIVVPDAPGAGGLETIVRTVGWASRLLGTVLVFSGILVGLAAVAVVGYWLSARDVALVIERGSADAVECPTTRANGQRALATLRELLSE